MAADGNLNFNTKINTIGFNKGLKSIESAVSKTTGSMKKLAAAVGLSFSAAALIKFGKDSLESAAEFNAAESQFEQSFGAFQSAAVAAIERVADESGILDTRLKSTATSIYAFAKTAKMESSKALSFMEEALQVAADSAAYYDRSLEDTTETLKSFLKGNYANDAALGLSVTETTRNAKATELYGKKFAELSEAQKQLTLLEMVKDANRLSGALGQAARESEGWENVLGNLKEAWRQLLVTVGQPVLQLALPVVKSMTAALQRMTDAAQIAWKALQRVFGWEDVQVTAISAAAESQNELTTAVEATEKAQEGALAGFDEIQTLTDKSAESAASGSDSGMLSEIAPSETVDGKLAIDIDTSGIEKTVQVVNSAVNEIKSIFFGLVGWIGTNVKPSFSDISNAIALAIPEIRSALTSAFSEFDSSAEDSFSGMKSNLEMVFADVGTLAAPLNEWLSIQLPTFLSSAISTIGLIIFGLFDTFNSVFADIWSNVIMPFSDKFISTILPIMTEFGTEFLSVFSNVFDEIKRIFDSIWTEGISPFLSKLMGYWSEAWDVVKAKWDEYGQPIFDGIKKAVNHIGDILMKTWTGLIKPVWDNFMQSLDWLWDKHLKPLWDNILDFVGVLVENALIIYNNVIAPIVKWIQDIIYPKIVHVVNAVWNIISSVIAGIIDVIGGLVTCLKGIIKFITGIFTLDWEKAWEGVNDMFDGLWQQIVGIAKVPINLVIDLLNSMINGIITGLNAIIGMANKISFDVPDWVPFVGGNHFGFDIPLIDKSAHMIPKLASGAVIPPNREFLAVLGDQKQGTNIEAPLETIKQAFREAMAESGSGSRNMTVVLQVSRRELGRTIVELGREEEQRVGLRVRS